MTVGQRLKAARIAAKMSRKELASQVQHSIHTIKAWELDKHRPSTAALRKLERVFRMERGQLSRPVEADHHAAISELKTALEQLSPSKRRHAIKIIEHFSQLISTR